MITAAMIEHDTVINLIHIDQTNFDDFNFSGIELIDAAPLGLATGDVRRDGNWYRGDEQLPIVPEEPEPPEISDYEAYYNKMQGVLE